MEISNSQNVHNPHYFEWFFSQKKNGQREPEEAPECVNTNRIAGFFSQTNLKGPYTICRQLIAINDLPRVQLKTDIEENNDIRLQILGDSISEQSAKTKLAKREIRRHHEMDLDEIHNSCVRILEDIIRGYYTKLIKIETHEIKHKKMIFETFSFYGRFVNFALELLKDGRCKDEDINIKIIYNNLEVKSKSGSTIKTFAIPYFVISPWDINKEKFIKILSRDLNASGADEIARWELYKDVISKIVQNNRVVFEELEEQIKSITRDELYTMYSEFIINARNWYDDLCDTYGINIDGRRFEIFFLGST